MSDVATTISNMLDKRRGWLASCERTLALLQPEWDRFQAREDHDIYVTRLYADHTSEARTHRKEIEALEASLAALANPDRQSLTKGENA